MKVEVTTHSWCEGCQSCDCRNGSNYVELKRKENDQNGTD